MWLVGVGTFGRRATSGERLCRGAGAVRTSCELAEGGLAALPIKTFNGKPEVQVPRGCGSRVAAGQPWASRPTPRRLCFQL